MNSKLKVNRQKKVVILGAGPAGLTAAYLLAQQKYDVTVLEADPEYVGGISKTAHYKGFLFDIGGHRFFSKSQKVEKFWDEILPNDFLIRPRSSRIFYRRRLFSYPLKAFEALFKLGIFESILCVFSYIRAKLFPVKDPKSFEDWVSNQFGKRLFSIFFKTYTEKVWGMSCKEISADWAAQRIKGLSLGTAIFHALVPKKLMQVFQGNKDPIKTLIDSFRYPRKGPGMLWEACAEKTRAMGGTIHLGQRVSGLEMKPTGPHRWKITSENTQSVGKLTFKADIVISTVAIRELVQMIQPAFAAPALKAAGQLKYRDFLTVMLILKDRDIFSDNWIYIHDPLVKVGRIQNFKSWSPEMIPDAEHACYGLEYFCFEGDGLWTSKDSDLVELAKRELEQLGLVKATEILDGCVVRQPKAYPVYDENYKTHVEKIKNEIESSYPDLHLIGRNGMHKYNNQDHAVMTAMLTVDNICEGIKVYDVWAVNQDAEYHETVNETLNETGNKTQAKPTTNSSRLNHSNRNTKVSQISRSSSTSGERSVPKRIA